MTIASSHGGLIATNVVKIDAERCHFKQNTTAGVQTCSTDGDTSVIEVKHCHSSRNGTVGYIAHKGGTILMVECTSDDDEFGALVSDSGVLRATGAVFRKSMIGARAMNGGTLNLIDCAARKFRSYAVFVSGQGTKLNVRGGCFVESQLHGIGVANGAQARLKDLNVSRSMSCGVIVSDKGSTMELDGCKLEEDAQDGGVALDDGQMIVNLTSSVGNNRSGGFVGKAVNKII